MNIKKTVLPFAALSLCLAPLARAAEPQAGSMQAEIELLKQRLGELEAQLARQAAPPPAPAKTVPAALAAATGGNSVAIGSTTVTVGGYVKADVMYSRFSDGEVAQGIGRDTYIPNTIPVSDGSGQSHEALDLHAKETRLFVRADTPLAGGNKIGAYLEMDFIVAQGSGNERATNAYNFGLRRAFVTYGNWLVGEEWTTFQNMNSLPETLDFVAFPTDGTVFGRQPIIRYTLGNLMLALENPETTYMPQGGGAFVDSGDGVLPDLVGRYNFHFSGGSELSVAGLLRQLKVDNGTPASEAKASAGGVSLAGKLALGKDDLKFQLNYGDGIGRYLALATAADAVLLDGELDKIRLLSGYLAYRHPWSPQWRSTATLSHLHADNDLAVSGGAVTRDVTSGSINLLYSPAPKLTFGIEYRHALRKVESGNDGRLDRVQFSTKYAY